MNCRIKMVLICGFRNNESAGESIEDCNTPETQVEGRLVVPHNRFEAIPLGPNEDDKSQPVWSVQWLAPLLCSCLMWTHQCFKDVWLIWSTLNGPGLYFNRWVVLV